MTKLPPYVIAGEWEDPDPLVGSFAQLSREHPYGRDAYQLFLNGKAYIFPSKEAAYAYQRSL